jgi:hypothetical protein
MLDQSDGDKSLVNREPHYNFASRRAFTPSARVTAPARTPVLSLEPTAKVLEPRRSRLRRDAGGSDEDPGQSLIVKGQHQASDAVLAFPQTGPQPSAPANGKAPGLFGRASSQAR